MLLLFKTILKRFLKAFLNTIGRMSYNGTKYVVKDVKIVRISVLCRKSRKRRTDKKKRRVVSCHEIVSSKKP